MSDATTPTPTAPERLLMRAKEVATALSISERTLRTWIATEFFPDADLVHGGKLKFWKRQTVLDWINRKTR